MFCFKHPNTHNLFIALLVLFSLVTNSKLFASFDEKECLESQFSIKITHQQGPMGLFTKKLILEKQKCLLQITEQQLKFFKNAWTVDVCRTPVHIKTQEGTVKVFKKEGPCYKAIYMNNPFCLESKKIKTIVQDDGLIFAPGEKESLQSDHGKTYCSYLLLTRYLDESIILSRDDQFHPFSFHPPAHYSAPEVRPSPTVTTPKDKLPPPPKVKQTDAVAF
jgi:hypothetical protein